MVDVGNDADDAEDVGEAEDAPKPGTVAVVDGDGFQHDGQPKNNVGLDRAGRRIRMPVLVELHLNCQNLNFYLCLCGVWGVGGRLRGGETW